MCVVELHMALDKLCAVEGHKSADKMRTSEGPPIKGRTFKVEIVAAPGDWGVNIGEMVGNYSYDCMPNLTFTCNGGFWVVRHSQICAENFNNSLTLGRIVVGKLGQSIDPG